MTKATAQEEILFLVRANERISAFQEKDFGEGEDKFEDGGFITKKRHYEILDDYEPAPSFLKSLTNEVLYSESNGEESILHQSFDQSLLEIVESGTEGDQYAYPDKMIKKSSNKETESQDVDPYTHVQKISETDLVPEIIKDSFVPNKNKSRNDGIDDLVDDNPLKDMLAKQQFKAGKTLQALNSSLGYNDSDLTGLNSYQYDKIGSSIDIERRIQHSIHSRQLQPTNTSQKLHSSRVNAYAGYEIINNLYRENSFEEIGSSKMNKSSIIHKSQSSKTSMISQDKNPNSFGM